MRIAVVIGTRPEIVKMTPVIRELEARKADFFVLHTGQHYSYEMDQAFFERLELGPARYNLRVGAGTHAGQTARMLVGIEGVLQGEEPDIVLVQGDTNTVLAGALAAVKMHIAVGHVEAGLRSYDRAMPEEINRVLADHCSDYLFAPTEGSKQTLLGEGFPEEIIHVTGNTIVDAVYQHCHLARQKSTAMQDLGLDPGEYVLVTLHRQENVDSATRFTSILEGLDLIAAEHGLPVVYPVHPRSGEMMQRFNLTPARVRLIDPLDFLDFLHLEMNARLVLTDSGGVQEETCILGVPCVTLRDNTERPETLEVGANVLAGTSPWAIAECARMMLNSGRNWPNPYGDGHAAKRIISVLMEARYE